MSFFSGVSNFNSAGPFDAFWQLGSSADEFIVCSTSGRWFVMNTQRLISTVEPGATYDGRRVSGSMVQVDGRFGPMTAKVLWLAAKNAGADAATLAAMQREAVARGSGPTGMRYLLNAAIRLLYTSMNPGRTAPPVHFPDQMIAPRWGIEAPEVLAGESDRLTPIRCTPLIRTADGWAVVEPPEPDALPGAPPTTTPAPAPSPPLAPPPPPPEQGGPPIPAAPPGPDDLPPGVTTRPVIETSGGVSWPVIGVGVAAVVVLSLLGLSLMKPVPARSTQLRRPSRRRYAVAA